jgi:hypothetical protein
LSNHQISRAVSTTSIDNCCSKPLIASIRFHLSQQANEEAEVAAGQSNDGGDDFRCGRRRGQAYSDRSPPLLRQYLDVRVAQRPKLVDETDAREELRVSCNAFLDARHPDEDHAKATFIEDGPQLLKAVHRQAIGFINHDQGGGVRDRFNPGFVFVENLVVRRFQGRRMVRSVVAIIAVRGAPSLVATTQSIERCPLFSASRSLGDARKNGSRANEC